MRLPRFYRFCPNYLLACYTYKAWDRNLKRWVVLKTQNEYLLHDPDYERYVQRFLWEGQMMARLARQEPHSHLVQVLDLFPEPAPDRSQGARQDHYLVMNFIEGEDLFKAVKRRGRLPEATVLTIAREIGSALAWMHRHECIHRDAHPGNIMLRPDGKAVLIDLGGAKEFVPSSQSSAGVFGNKGFAPYEQMIRAEGIRQPSADIFCFAGSLYFAVTGQPPASSLERKLSGMTLTPPRQLVSISEELNQMLMAGLELEAADRPQTIQDFLAYLQPKPIAPPREKPTPEPEPEPTIKPPQPHGKTNIAWGWLIGCVVAYAFVGIGVSVGASTIAITGSIVSSVAVGMTWAVSMAITVAVPSLTTQVLVPVLTPSWAWAWVGVWIGAVFFVGAVGCAVAWYFSMALAIVMIWPPFWAGAVATAGAGAGAWALAGAPFWAWSTNWEPFWAWAIAGTETGPSPELWPYGWHQARLRARAIALTVTAAAVVAVTITTAGLLRGSWEIIRGLEGVFLSLWWGTWPWSFGVLPGLIAGKRWPSYSMAIALPTIASWLGLALGVLIYRAVHPV